jgi:two-component system, NarL family, invasion response regulator UvrY
MKKRIIVIDDEPLIPALMKEIIEEDPGLEISHVATDKEGFISSVLESAYDAALLDISVAGHRQGGLDILQALKDRSIDMPVIMLSAHDELDYALRCLQAGAKGYISKNNICTDLVRGLNEVLEGKMFVSGQMGSEIINSYHSSASNKS